MSDKKKRLVLYLNETKRRQYEKDCKLFINELCWTQNEKGVDRFILRDYQEEALDCYLNHKRIIFKKGRQLGFSWLAAAYVLWYAMFHDNRTLLIMSKNESESIDQLNRTKFMISRLHKYYKPRLLIDNAQELLFDNGTRIKSLPASEQAGRGTSAASVVIWDEAAFTPHDQDVWKAILPAVEHGQLIMQSTVNGMGNLFHATWGMEGWHKLEVLWDRHPDRDEAWAIKEGKDSKDNFLRITFEQEHGGSFLGSSMNVFAYEQLEEMKKRRKPVLERRDGLNIYEKYTPGEKYAIGVDVAEGLIKGDYSVIVVMNKKTNEVAAVYRKRVPIHTFPNIIFDISRMYGEALIAVEKNFNGTFILQALKQMGANLYHQKTYDNYAQKFTTRIGWITSSKTKGQAIQELARLVANYEIGIHDEDTLSELGTYMYEQSGNVDKMNAAQGYHDDTVMALAICNQCLKDVILPEERKSIIQQKSKYARFPEWKDLERKWGKKSQKKVGKCAYFKK
jgi:hypothetical protein